MTAETYYNSEQIKKCGSELDGGIIKLPLAENHILVALLNNGLLDGNKREIGVAVDNGKTSEEILVQAKLQLGGNKSKWKEMAIYSVPEEKLQNCRMFPSENVEQSRTIRDSAMISS